MAQDQKNVAKERLDIVLISTKGSIELVQN